MCSRRVSDGWLSNDMARALAAMCPPLKPADVRRAADRLGEYPTTNDIVVVDGMFKSDMDRVNLRNVIAALRALYDVGQGQPRPAH